MGAGVAAIVGVGPGIGLAVARRFARAGFDLALLARSASRLEGHQAALADLGRQVLALPCDASDAYALAKAFQEVRERLGHPSVLVFNASQLREAPPSRVSPEAFVREFRTNCVAALVCAQEVLPEMRRQGRGTILITGGGLAIKPHAALASLSIGKGAVRTLAFLLADEVEADGVHVATVTVDGFVKAGTRLDPEAIAEEYWRLHGEARDRWTREVLLQ